MRNFLLVLSAMFIFNSLSAQAKFEPAELVNPLMGSLSTYSLSSGNTYPAIARPWGMNFWTPQTAKNGDGWQYYYNADKIRGFKQTHQPSPWINDYGVFSIMPVTGKILFREGERGSYFSHKAETARPYYYSAYMADYNTTVEFTPTDRGCMFRISYPATDTATLVIDAYDKGSYIKIIPSEQKIIGYSTRNHGGVPENFRNYFVMYFDRPFSFQKTWSEDTLSTELEKKALHSGAVLGFDMKHGGKLHVRIASSFISPAQAELNLSRELGNSSFEQIKKEGAEIWNHELSRIKVSGGSEEQIRTFYSCLYRVLLFPRKFYEINAADEIVHYSPYNGKVEKGYMFTDNGFWDTFRAVFPFFNLMYRELNSHIMQGLVNVYKESGWLPEWQSPGHRNCMIGSNSASIISDAYVKGVRGYDINTLYEAMRKNMQQAGPMESVGRAGADYYNTLGYVPYDVGINENAARTLEYAYDDFTISRVARMLNRPETEIQEIELKALNYRHLFDPSTRLMRGKNKDGRFQSPFNPFKWGDAFTEGNSWHYSWSVFHDINGLKDLMGGDKNFIGMLDSVFVLPPIYDESYYGSVIHEIREMQIMNFGQYAHGNQPIQHMIYLYNYAGQPWKAQYWVREVMDRLYHSGPDGYCGDEDNGQTSAWYVFSALGFYPVCPGVNEYVLGAPLFKKAILTLENNKQIIINAPENSTAKRYIGGMTFNKKEYTHNYLDHNLLMEGAVLDLQMGGEPNKKRGVNSTDFPYSMSKKR